MKKFKKPGLRIFKTALAVFLSLCISYLRNDAAIPFYAAIAALICMKTGIDETIEIGVNRVFGTLVGGLSGLLYLLTFKRLMLDSFINYLLISLVIFVLIWIMSNLDKPNAITIMCVVLLSITLNHGQEVEYPFTFALNRVIDTLIGVVVAVFVNWFDFEIRKTNKKDNKNKKN